MTALLSCSMSWSKNECDTIPSTGGVYSNSDSVLIAINDIRIVNAKLIELKYEKQINDSLRSIIVKDDELIRAYDNQTNEFKKQIKQVKRERNIASWIGGGLALLLAITIIK